jgi:hypothetical protein
MFTETVYWPNNLCSFSPTTFLRIISTSDKHSAIYARDCRAIAQAVSRWLPPTAARVRAWVWSSEICGGQNGSLAGTSVFPAILYSTKFSILIITRGTYNRPINGRRVEWTQFGLHPPLWEFKFFNYARDATSRNACKSLLEISVNFVRL